MTRGTPEGMGFRAPGSSERCAEVTDRGAAGASDAFRQVEAEAQAAAVTFVSAASGSLT